MKVFIIQNIFSKIIVLICQCFVLLSFNSVSSAQLNRLHDSWRWVRFTTDDGLPSNRVFNIVETTSGTAWALTQSGLAWFNGYYWEPINEQKGLPSRKLDKIIPDVNDSLLVLFDFHLYYGGEYGFRRIPIIYNGREKKVHDAAFFDNKGYLLLCDSSLYIWRNGSTSPYLAPPEIRGQKIYGIFSTKGIALWLNTANGLYRRDGYSWSLKFKTMGAPFAIRLFAEDKNRNGLAFIDGPRNAFGLWEWRQGAAPILNTKEGTDNIISFDHAPNSEMLMVKESGEVKIRNASRWFSMDSPPPQLKNIVFVQFRVDGNLWVGTENGLYYHNANAKRWTIWKYTSPDRRNNVNELLKTKDGSIWVGSGNGFQIHRPDGKVEDVHSILNKELGLVTGLAEDADGNVWVSSGSTFEGAYRWDGSRWKHFGIEDGLDAGYIHKIKNDGEGRLWFLGLNRPDYLTRNVESEPGAYVFMNGHFTQWGKKHGLLNGRVYSFVKDLEGSYWFGTNAGLSRWKPDNTNGSSGKWTHWTTEQGFRMGKVFTIAVDSQNGIWFSDQNIGLGWIAGDELRYLTTENGLVSNAVWDIRVDEQGKIWIATRGGISIYDNGTFSSLSMVEGLENTRIWPLLPTKDKVYIGTSGGGVMIFNFEGVAKELPRIRAYPPLISESTVNLHWRVFSFWGEQLSDNIEIRYRLDNESWSNWDRERHTILGGVLSGEHIFQLQIKNLIGHIDTIGQKVSFSIDPPFYRQPRFFIPVGFLSIGMIILGMAYLVRKQRQDAAIKKSEARYRNLFENANDAIMIFEPKDEIILEVNKKACELYGYDRKEFIGKSLKNIRKNIELGEKAIEQTLRERKKETVETVHSTKDGGDLHIIASTVIIDYEGQNAISSINRDITELRQAEAKQRLLAQTVASAKDAICITDLNNKFLYVNDAFIDMYGYSEEDLNGKHISLIASPDVPEEFQKEIYKTTIEDGDWNGEVINRRKDESSFPVELWSSVVYDVDNKPVALVGVARDITDRKKFEEERENLIKDLKTAIAEVKTLGVLLPICSSCKKIRDDEGYWGEVESYIMKHSDATFTHGLCPECISKYFPEIANKVKQ